MTGCFCTINCVSNLLQSRIFDSSSAVISKFHIIRARMSCISIQAMSLPMHLLGPTPKCCVAPER